jgi:DNA-nicking Smr family endonuclease
VSRDKKKKSKVDKDSPFAALEQVKAKMVREEEERAATKAQGKRPPPMTTPSQRPTKPPRADPEEDRLAFHRLMSGVVPLDSKQGRVAKSQVPRSTELVPARPKDLKSAAQLEAEEVHAHLRALVEGKERFEVEDDGRRVEGRRVDLPVDMLRKLRRGLVPIDARMDLHGLGAGEARAAVESFLRDKRVAGERCVLVVHGKGDHSPRGQPVLRGEIAAWLSQGPASEHVAAFATATSDDGGEGAVYVLLRK